MCPCVYDVCMHTYNCVIWVQCFRRGREDLKAAHQRINRMLADYGDVVPRREHEQLQTAYEVSL